MTDFSAGPTARVAERARRIDDLATAVLRAQTCHPHIDPNQLLLAEIEERVTALQDDARLRVAHTGGCPT